MEGGTNRNPYKTRVIERKEEKPMELYEAMKNRRSRYALSAKSPVSNKELEQLLRDAVQYTPSAFHSQSSRAVLLLGESHSALWRIVMEALRAIVKPERFAETEAKINSFAGGYGTILYFEDMGIVEGFQKAVPNYAENFPVWSNQSAGMLQYAVWTALSAKGLGASLQHYNPLIDTAVKQTFDIPENWRLLAQMPFGVALSEPARLEYDNLAARVIVKESML